MTFFENPCFSFGLIYTCFDLPKQEISKGDRPWVSPFAKFLLDGLHPVKTINLIESLNYAKSFIINCEVERLIYKHGKILGTHDATISMFTTEIKKNRICHSMFSARSVKADVLNFIIRLSPPPSVKIGGSDKASDQHCNGADGVTFCVACLSRKDT